MTVTIAQALTTAQKQIDALDARVLLRNVLRVPEVYLIAHGEEAMSSDDQSKFQALVDRRIAGEPVAYIVGEREFYGVTFGVTPAVLIPRPETELLIELALNQVPRDRIFRVLDLGTGSGCVAISIAVNRPGARLVAVDISDEALQVARDNAQWLDAYTIEFRQGDWFAGLVAEDERFDLIVSNPPYVAAGDEHLAQGDVRFEPRTALISGADGLDGIRAIIARAPRHLVEGAWLLFEHGYDQAERCRGLLSDAGFTSVQSWRDLAGIERVSGGCCPAVDAGK